MGDAQVLAPAEQPPGNARRRMTNDYSALAAMVRPTGLMRRRYGYYWTRLVLTVLAFAGVWTAVALVGDSWWQLLVAAVMAVVLTQLAFLGHDGAHRQIFRSRAWNDWTARVVAGGFVGLSYGWWTDKHDAHHSAPNQVDADPDIGVGAIAFTREVIEERRGLRRWCAERQGWFFFPLLMLEGLNLHVSSVRTVFGRRPLAHRGVEASLVLARIVLYLVVVVWIMPVGLAAAFVGVQLALFGVLLGGAFAPNHKGMPIVPRDANLDFLRRQVLMSRNIRGGVVVDFLMGGLNRQVEHHLFPGMPRPNLAQVQPLVRTFCERLGVSYTEVGLVASYRIVLGYLNDVEHRMTEPFTCPVASAYGR
ncbi:fatty acid desaturase family protein [Luteimicrobium subarcticum]|uniref:Fatty acid desaturase n=1 Tax=Luteimicrobium subarcticum TaxID=620910 RepID=A0A2M8W6S6_9MICO|nr:acyl-CoA desaturase [Luteimicrobium subarcticum]PJI86631.1 fatty acid desaturase [Luteimicrobium subarcticum]